MSCRSGRMFEHGVNGSNVLDYKLELNDKRTVFPGLPFNPSNSRDAAEDTPPHSRGVISPG
jgi:hypothetical protein